jgi:hypothetical protein
MSDKLRNKKAGGRKDKKNQAARQDVAARRAGQDADRPKIKGTGAPKSSKPGHQTPKPGRGEQARVGRHARKPGDSIYREGQRESLSGPSEKVQRVAATRTGGTGDR